MAPSSHRMRFVQECLDRTAERPRAHLLQHDCSTTPISETSVAPVSPRRTLPTCPSAAPAVSHCGTDEQYRSEYDPPSPGPELLRELLRALINYTAVWTTQVYAVMIR
jgi:hypothetical protein